MSTNSTYIRNICSVDETSIDTTFDGRSRRETIASSQFACDATKLDKRFKGDIKKGNCTGTSLNMGQPILNSGDAAHSLTEVTMQGACRDAACNVAIGIDDTHDSAHIISLIAWATDIDISGTIKDVCLHGTTIYTQSATDATHTGTTRRAESGDLGRRMRNLSMEQLSADAANIGIDACSHVDGTFHRDSRKIRPGFATEQSYLCSALINGGAFGHNIHRGIREVQIANEANALAKESEGT